MENHPRSRFKIASLHQRPFSQVLRPAIRYSQNFIKNSAIIVDLLKQTSLTKNDLVLDIGAGNGLITKELVNRCKKVLSFEIDPLLYVKLDKELSYIPNLELVHTDFLTYPLPLVPFKVFANIPFNATAQIISKLLHCASLTDCYLFVQKEAAIKYAGQPYADETLQSVLNKILFEIKIVHTFKATDFEPIPNITICLLHCMRRTSNLIENAHISQFKDFVSFVYSHANPELKAALRKLFIPVQLIQIERILKRVVPKNPRELFMADWIHLFTYFLDALSPARQKLIIGWRAKMEREGQSIEKIHRTRLDKNWLLHK